MAARWIGCASANFRAGRPPGLAPAAIVLHRSGGTLDALRRRFADPASSISAHYCLGVDGSVEQYVSETDTAFHAGIILYPTWAGLRPQVNPNYYTIGVELEERGENWPDAQCAATAALVAGIAARWSIQLSRDTVVPHSAIRSSVSCPGTSAPLDRIIGLARSATVEHAMPAVSKVKVLVNANLRPAPRRSGSLVRIVPSGTDFAVCEFTDAGERINGNPFWYRDASGNFLWAGATSVPTPTAPGDDADAGTPSGLSTDEMDLSVAGEPGGGESANGPQIDRTSLVLPPAEYYAQEFRKDLIVLHFTAGATARSAVNTWRSNPEHVATAYVVDMDGTIYEVFPPQYWAYHLGIKGGTPLERRSIGIEIANVGPLEQDNNSPSVLNWWPKNWRQKYCTREESDRYVEATFRGKRYFASYAGAQLDSVARLVRYLSDRFGVPRRLPSTEARLCCDPTFAGYKGIATHVNFRPDKWDVGPAFDWDRLGL
jgi:N-acetyl-anhydromuramyl-L-alanine amidase AmpD